MVFGVGPRLRIPRDAKLADIPFNGSCIKVEGVVDPRGREVYAVLGTYGDRPVIAGLSFLYGYSDTHAESDIGRPVGRSEVGRMRTMMDGLKRQIGMEDRDSLAVPEVPQEYFEGRWVVPQTRNDARQSELFSR